MAKPEIEYSGAEAIEASARMMKIALDHQSWTVTLRDEATGRLGSSTTQMLKRRAEAPHD